MTDKKNLVIGTAGHIDHGKTSIVRALTGVETDRLPAEIQRGITIDLGFASLELDRHHLAIIDVPGHERYIRNMLAGACGLNLAMLVVAADDSVMPQTREHLEILTLLKLTGGVIVLTKCDLVDKSWLGLVESDIRNEVANTFLESAEIIRTSALTGQGIGQLKDSLVKLCDAVQNRPEMKPFRMPIDRSFSIPGHGTVVTGTIVSGQVAVGDELELLPEARFVRVRGVHQHDRRVDRIGCGARAAINLAGVHHKEIHRGNELAAPGYLTASKILSVEMSSMGELQPRVRHRARYRLHLGTAEVGATLSELEAAECPGDHLRLAQLFLDQAVTAVHGQPFVIRQESPPMTLGGGLIIQPEARRIRRRDTEAISRLRQLSDFDPSTKISAALGFIGLSPWSFRSLSRDTGISEANVNLALEDLASSRRLVEVSLGPGRSIKLPIEIVVSLEDRVLRTLRRFHQAEPRHATILLARVASALTDLGDSKFIEAIIERLKAQGKVVAAHRRVAMAAHTPRLSQGERRLKTVLLELIRSAGLSPPGHFELIRSAGARSETVSDMITLLVEEESIVEVAPQLYLAREVEEQLRETVIKRLSDGSSSTMAELRDLLGTSRKFAVPIGEYLDRIGLTIRQGDLRSLADRWKSEADEGGRSVGE